MEVKKIIVTLENKYAAGRKEEQKLRAKAADYFKCGADDYGNILEDRADEMSMNCVFIRQALVALENVK